MSAITDFDKLTENLPEYDVFNDSTPIGATPKKAKDIGFIEYDEETDFRNTYNQEPPEEEEDHHTDYDDGFGVYQVEEKRRHNILTLLMFPLSILWLEIMLRINCQQNILSFSLIYICVFSFAFAGFFTLICTFADEKFNRTLANIILLLLTLLYLIQGIYFNSSGEFLTLSSFSKISWSEFFGGISANFIPLILMCIPLLLNLIFGRFIFPFRRIIAVGKIFLALAIVILHILGIGIIAIDNICLPRSDKIYYTQLDANASQQRFGLLTTERLDVTSLIKSNSDKQ